MSRWYIFALILSSKIMSPEQGYIKYTIGYNLFKNPVFGDFHHKTNEIAFIQNYENAKPLDALRNWNNFRLVTEHFS